MPTHAEQRHLPYSQKQLFDLVASVERYPEFLPWCSAARITRHDGDTFHADLVVRFKMFKERFTSRVTLHRYSQIDVEYINGPFRYLNNHWVLQKLIGLLFNEAVSRMVGAFETRARQLYGERTDRGDAHSPCRPAASRA
jgi:coenzyme Q-binding protein COQ10